MIVHANRASAIIYNLLRSSPPRRPFLLPANVCPVVPAVFHKAGVAFEFVDITEEDYCVDREIVLDRVRSHRFGGLLLVRTYGYFQALDSYFADLRNLDEDLLLIDDRCLCEPSFDSPTGTADVILYSTGPKKFVDLGYGGFARIDERIPYRHQPLSYSGPATARLEQKYKRCIDRRARFVYVDGGRRLAGQSHSCSFRSRLPGCSRRRDWTSQIHEIHDQCVVPSRPAAGNHAR